MRAPALVWLALALVGCRSEPAAGVASGASAVSGPIELAAVEAAFSTCLDGDPAAGLTRLDSLMARAPSDPDGRVARGLCRWALWDETADEEDARGAYADLSAAIEAVEGGAAARGTPLDQIYAHRAFVARAVGDGGWVRTVEDLGRAVELAPGTPQHRLDRGVVHVYAGDTLAARRDLRQYLALTDSTAPADPERRSVVEALLIDLGDAPDAGGP